MARGTSLLTLRQMLKAEIGDSLSVGSANDTTYNQALATKQQWMAGEWDWAFLEKRADVTVGAGVRYKVLPVLNLERPLEVEVKRSERWQPVLFGIDSGDFNYRDSDTAEAQDPILRWRLHDLIELSAPAVGSMAASGTAGAQTFNYKVTFYTEDGETDPSSGVAAASVNAPNVNSITLSAIPTDSLGYATGRKIYRSKNGAPTVFYLLTTITDNTTTSFVDTIADASLPATLIPSLNTAELTLFEVWPLPATTQTLRFTGQRPVRALAADTDNADMDDVLLVLSVAYDRLMLLDRTSVAQTVAQRAQARFRSVRANYPTRTRTVIVGGCDEDFASSWKRRREYQLRALA